MKAYHEIQPDKLGSILTHGLRRTSRGEKGADKAIIQTDHFLDACRPQSLRVQSVSRDNNLYAYVRMGDSVISITDGRHIPIDKFIAASAGQILEIDIDPKRCFISDLDTYDALKSAVEAHESRAMLDKLAKSYWDKIVRLSDTDLSLIRRPEIMVTYDISPEHLRVAYPRQHL